jgi:PHD/YefM family antitoxin component YafN of YafNO toxin-antitoxin module
MSLDDFNALEETAYLLESSENAKRLNSAVADFKKNINFTKIKI